MKNSIVQLLCIFETSVDNFLFCNFMLTFILLKLNVSSTENSVDPDQLASSDQNPHWFSFTL